VEEQSLPCFFYEEKKASTSFILIKMQAKRYLPLVKYNSTIRSENSLWVKIKHQQSEKKERREKINPFFMQCTK
jgi:hypothetical protein